MSVVTFDLTCPTCDRAVHLVNAGRATTTEFTVVTECRHCSTEWALNTRLFRVGATATSALCGTSEGLRWHRRNSTPYCAACKTKAAAIERHRAQLARTSKAAS